MRLGSHEQQNNARQTQHRHVAHLYKVILDLELKGLNCLGGFKDYAMHNKDYGLRPRVGFWKDSLFFFPPA